ncbi:hypothetical protein HZS_4313 [Henneguya salminicola]|nr:hypothetical protein HZS_4313 [Henneguya salminicola]
MSLVTLRRYLSDSSTNEENEKYSRSQSYDQTYDKDLLDTQQSLQKENIIEYTDDFQSFLVSKCSAFSLEFIEKERTQQQQEIKIDKSNLSFLNFSSIVGRSQKNNSSYK